MMEIITDAILAFTASLLISRFFRLAQIGFYRLSNVTGEFGGVYDDGPIAFLATAIIAGKSYGTSNNSTMIMTALMLESILLPMIIKSLRTYILLEQHYFKDKPAVKVETSIDVFFNYAVYIQDTFCILEEIYDLTQITHIHHTMYQLITFSLRRWLQGIIITLFSRSIITGMIKPSVLQLIQLPQTCTSKYQMWGKEYRCIVTDMVLGIIIIANDINCEHIVSIFGAIWLIAYTAIRFFASQHSASKVLKNNLVSLSASAQVNENDRVKQIKLHFPFTNYPAISGLPTGFPIEKSPTAYLVQTNAYNGTNDVLIQIDEEQNYKSNVAAMQNQYQQCHMIFPQYQYWYAVHFSPQKYSFNSTQCPDVFQQYPPALWQGLCTPQQSSYCSTQQDTSLATSKKATVVNVVSKQLAYPMKSSPCGIGVVINNENFIASKPRFGTAIDAQNLENLFHYLNFDTQHHNNKTHIEMRHILNDVAGMDHDKYDCLMVAILTHGDYGDLLYGTSGAIVIQEVIETFSGKRCPTLIGKPKIFIIQACRGRRYNQTVELNDRSDDECDMIDSGPTVHPNISPNISDYLVAYSTIPGHVSFRNNNVGSIFISTLVKVFRRHAPDEDLITMLERVTNEVTRYQPQDGRLQDSRQTPELRSTLKGKVYFNSGNYS